MWTLLCVLAWAGGDPAWRDAPADVVADRILPVPAAAVIPQLDDLARLSVLFPETCTEVWALGVETRGTAATARVTYRHARYRRRLTVRYGRMLDNQLVEIVHEGKLGLTSQFRLEEVEGGTAVQFITYLEQPPWPLSRYFVFQVHPAWTACHEGVLEALDSAVRR